LQAQVNTIEITITNFESNDGNAIIAVYDSEANFLNTRYKGDVVGIKDNIVVVSFTNIPDGVYAVSAVHDENNDGKLNMKMGFYPTEDTASSNHAPARFGPPTWEDAKFKVQGGKVIRQIISM
jgi:uncharacterized protein (DUF2141 family)